MIKIGTILIAKNECAIMGDKSEKALIIGNEYKVQYVNDGYLSIESEFDINHLFDLTENTRAYWGNFFYIKGELNNSSNMKYWIEGKSENGYGEKGILLKEGNERILSVIKNENGIQFMEECDGCFSHTYTKEDALKLVDELREWINLR